MLLDKLDKFGCLWSQVTFLSRVAVFGQLLHEFYIKQHDTLLHLLLHDCDLGSNLLVCFSATKGLNDAVIVLAMLFYKDAKFLFFMARPAVLNFTLLPVV